MIKHNGYELSLGLSRYQVDGSIAIQLFCKEGPYATASVWIPGLAEDEVAIKDHSENEGIYDALYEGGVIEVAHRFEASGFVIIPICHLTEAAKEYGIGVL